MSIFVIVIVYTPWNKPSLQLTSLLYYVVSSNLHRVPVTVTVTVTVLVIIIVIVTVIHITDITILPLVELPVQAQQILTI